jgi:outer membrane protein TolC
MDMKKFFGLMAIFFAFSFGVPLGADEASLDWLTEASLKNNPEIAAMKFDYQAKEKGSASVMSLMEPMFGFEMMNLPLTNPGMEAEAEVMSEKKFSLTQTLPFPGKIGAEIAMQKSLAKTALVQYEKSLTDMKREIRLMYYEITHMGKTIDLMQQKKEQLAAFLKVIQTRYQTGSINSTEYIRAKLMLAMVEREIISMGTEKKTMLENLKRMAAIKELPSNIVFDYEKISDLNQLKSEELLGLAKANFTDLRLMQTIEDNAAKELKAAQWSWAPDIDLGLSLSLPEGGGSTWSFMVGISLPTYFFSKQVPAVKSAEAMKNGAAKQLEDTTNRIEENIKVSLELVQQDYQILQLIEDTSLQEAKRGLDIAFKEYLVEKISFDVLLNQVITIFDLYLEKENIVFNIHKQIQNLKYYTNDELKLVEGRR